MSGLRDKFFPPSRPVVRAVIPLTPEARERAVVAAIKADQGDPLPAVIGYVCAKHKLTVDQVTGRGRQKRLVDARQDVSVILREQFQLDLAVIGNALGGRDHTSVTHYLKRAKGMRRRTSGEGTKYYYPEAA